ncbi:ubiD family decarboxylase [Diplocarpon rosae]|nr:ubiD family decarboxylase [Diplocarpon rosae]
MTIVANAPILHDLWRHGWDHIQKGKMGHDIGIAPEYELNIRAPTGSTEARTPSRVETKVARSGRESSCSVASRDSDAPENSDDQETEVTPMTQNTRARLGIRRSIRIFNDRLRQSLEKLEIETRVDIIQRSGTGEMTPSPSDDRMEEFCGGSAAGARTARISTSISTADKKPLPIGPRYVLAKFHGSEACG